MCGIAGIYSQTRQDVIHNMMNAIAHRGPDGNGLYRDTNIALGHQRLSIIDLEGGKQPIANETNDIFLICNGEIYNSPELRKNLIQKGHSFKTQTDVEVIVHLYEEFGDDCVKHLRGMFAFAIWDSVKQRLLLARDHMGQKPLFFYRNNNEFIFASEVKSILSTQVIKPEVDLDAIWHYISLRFVPDQYSLFKNINKLPAGNILVWEKNNLNVQRYWKPEFENKINLSEHEITEQLDGVIGDAVESHMLSDVTVGAFLSGGIDSSLVTALMAKKSSENIPVFSIGTKDQTFNEVPFAKLVADEYGLQMHDEIVEPNYIQLVPKLIYHLDEPSDPFGFGVYLVSKLASKHVKTVLTGDGGDENFAGYDRFAGQRLVSYYCLLPKWLRNKVMRRIFNNVPESFGYKSIAQKLLWLDHMSGYEEGARYAESASFLRFTPDAKKELFTKQAQDSLVDKDSYKKILTYFDVDDVHSLVDKMLYTDLMTRMPDHLLSTVDRMAMAHSLETRSPLVDHKVVEYAASIPSTYKLKNSNLKYILKKVASKHLPKELIYRKKQGFSFPIARWLRGDLKGLLNYLLENSRFVDNDLFAFEYLAKLRDEHISGQMDHNYRLWIFINLELWYRIYFENESVESCQELIRAQT